MRRAALATAAVLVAVLSTTSGFASAYETPEGGTLTVQVEEYWTMEGHEDFDEEYNWSEMANLTQYALLGEPFMNASGVDGTYTGTFYPPVVAAVSDGATEAARFGGLARFKSEWVMSGSSWSWWRCPVLNLGNWTTLELAVWHVDNPALLSTSGAYMTPSAAAHPTLVFNQTYGHNATQENVTWFQHNETAWGFEFNLTWVRVVAPVHADRSYYYRFYVQQEYNDAGLLAMWSSGDIGDDSVNRSWFAMPPAEPETVDGDLDLAVVHQYGMGAAVSGFNVSPGEGEESVVHFYVDCAPAADHDDVLTFAMAFQEVVTNDTNVRVLVQDGVGYSWEFWVASEGPADFALRSSAFDGLDDTARFEVTLTFQNASNAFWIYDAWSDYAETVEGAGAADTTNRFWMDDDPVYPYGVYVHFSPVCALQSSPDGGWLNTNPPPVYMLSGRYYNAWELQRKEHNDPLWLKILRFSVWIPFYVYNTADKFFLRDVLPDLTMPMYVRFLNAIADRLWDHPGPIIRFINRVAFYVHEFVDAVVKYGPAVLYFLARVIFMVIMVPAFVAAVLYVNGVKRFFVVFAAFGPVAAADYATRFNKNVVATAQQVYGAAARGRMAAGKVALKVVGR